MLRIERDGENAYFMETGNEEFAKRRVLNPKSDADGRHRISVRFVRCHHVASL